MRLPVEKTEIAPRNGIGHQRQVAQRGCQQGLQRLALALVELLGKLLETRARKRLSDAVRGLVALVPKTARRVTGDHEADVPVDGYQWMFRQGATAGLIPTNDGLTCVFAGASPGRSGPPPTDCIAC